MKINVVIQPDPSDADAAGPVLQTLRDIGFTDTTADDGAATLTYDGEITVNALAYGASMTKSLLSGRK